MCVGASSRPASKLSERTTVQKHSLLSPFVRNNTTTIRSVCTQSRPVYTYSFRKRVSACSVPTHNMVRSDPYTPTRYDVECYECSFREHTDSRPGRCPACGGPVHNVAVPRE
ncbi:rubrerythrin-like domain-containing protein [Natrialbaceae archaeon A-CW2]